MNLKSHLYEVYKEPASKEDFEKLFQLIKTSFSLKFNSKLKKAFIIEGSTVICSSFEWYSMLQQSSSYWLNPDLKLTGRFKKIDHILPKRYINKFPIFTQVKITARCQMKCPFCYYADKKNVDIPLSKLKKIFKLKGGIDWILHGGEPFLHPDFKKILKIVPSKPSVSTNGLSFRPNMNLSKIKHFSISFDLDRFYLKGYYKKFIKSLKNLNRKEKVFLTVSSLREPREVFKAYEQLRKDLNEPRIAFSLERLVSDKSPTNRSFLEELTQYVYLSTREVLFIPKMSGISFQPGCGKCSPMIDVDLKVRNCSKIKKFKAFELKDFHKAVNSFEAERQRRRFICRYFGCPDWNICSTGGMCHPIIDFSRVCSVLDKELV